jgi:2-hydroxymuconate-semialdehyde hydrolase
MLEIKSTTFEGLPVTYWEGGLGDPLLMLHGSGPGASTEGNWRLVLETLSEHYHVIAPDLIGFGRSGRKASPPYFDMALWQRQARFMLTLFRDGPVALIGHSLSGPIALRTAAAEPRVRAVLTTGSLGVPFATNAALERTWTFPATRQAIRDAGETLVYRRELIDDTYIDGRVRILHDGHYGDYFSSMFAGPKGAYIDAAVVSDADLAALTCEVLLVHGKNDLPVPWEETALPLARRIPQADLHLVNRCGHSPALEYPDKFIALATEFFQ